MNEYQIIDESASRGRTECLLEMTLFSF